MRVYLACTVRGDRGGVVAARAIANRLQRLGHQVFTTHLLDDNADETEGATMSEEQVFRRDIEWLTQCDVLIAEASGSTYGVGFEVGYVIGRAPQTGQRVVLLYDRARRDAISRLIPGNCDRHCTTIGYASLAELDAIVDEYCGSAPSSRVDNSATVVTGDPSARDP